MLVGLGPCATCAGEGHRAIWCPMPVVEGGGVSWGAEGPGPTFVLRWGGDTGEGEKIDSRGYSDESRGIEGAACR